MGVVLLENLQLWLPELILSVGAMAVLLAGAWSKPEGASRPTAPVGLAGTAIAAAAVALAHAPSPGPLFSGLIQLDPVAAVFRWIALGVVALTMPMALSSKDIQPRWTAECLGLLLLVGVGLMLMASANHLLMAYLSMELVSLSSYALSGMTRDARSSEAALKYLLYGALTSGIMLFGMSLVFGLTGELSLPAIGQAVASLDPGRARALAAVTALLLAGLAFKISMVPFHMWTPDVYEGAPIAVTAMLSVGPKAAGLALLFRIMGDLEPLWGFIAPTFLLLTVVTMTFGNLVALAQTNVKRLLAYSTIGQVGYLLIGFAVNTQAGLEAVALYLVAYLFMNLGAFACVTAVVNATGSEMLETFRGLGRRNPWLAFCMTLFLLSLAGMPPLIGFIGKFMLFGSAIETRQLGLAVAGVINSAIALYYYMNIVRLMYLHPPASQERLVPALSLRLAVLVCAVSTVGLGLFPSRLLAWISRIG